MFNCSRNTVHELARRYKHTGDVHDRPRPGRPRATTQRDDRAIVLTHLRDMFRPATLTAPTFNVTAPTIRNRLRADKSRYNLSHADGRARVYRRQGERFAPVCVRQYDRFGGGDVMVWAV